MREDFLLQPRCSRTSRVRVPPVAQMSPDLAPRRLHEAKHQQAFLVVSSVVPYQPSSQALTESELNLYHSRYADKVPLRPKGGRACLRKSCRIIFPAVLASVAAISMLIFVCSFAQRRGQPTLFARRQLSDDKPSSSKRLLVCGNTEQKADGPSSAEDPSTLDLCGVSTPSPKRAKSDSDENPQSGEGGPEAPEAPEAPNVPVVPGKLHGRWSLAELSVADALLLLRQAPAGAEQTPGVAMEQQEEEPHPSTSGIYAPSTAPGAQEGDAVAQPFPLLSPGDCSVAASPTAPGDRLAARPPETPPNHIFFRLPTLEPGALVRAFDTRVAGFYRLGSAEAAAVLRESQLLLAKERVSQSEAEALIGMAEKLAAHCYRDQRFPLSNKDHGSAVEVAGFRFLVLDTLLSIFRVTGQGPPAGWWQEFAKVVPHTRDRPPGKKATGRKPLHLNLAEALSRGLAILKRGARPSDGELFRIKYMLFCPEHPLKRFRRPAYKPWREQCPGTEADQ